MAERHFYEQKKHTKSYLIPFFQKYLPNFETYKILEIGCAEAGFLDALYELGIETAGLELEGHRVRTAMEKNPELNISVGDITDEQMIEQIGNSFDLIVMKDTIEHIPDRRSTFSNIVRLLKKKGYLYVTFPPKFSPFAGHQQNGKSILQFIPYLHLLPEKIIRESGKIFRERPKVIESVILNSRVGLTIRSFEKYCTEFNFYPVVKELFLFRPIYKTRFGIDTRRVPNIPILREFISFGCEYLLQKRR